MERVQIYTSEIAPPTDAHYPGMPWMDISTSPPVLKVRNRANNAWLATGVEAVPQAHASTHNAGGDDEITEIDGGAAA